VLDLHIADFAIDRALAMIEIAPHRDAAARRQFHTSKLNVTTERETNVEQDT
jgi:hypothetical protein